MSDVCELPQGYICFLLNKTHWTIKQCVTCNLGVKLIQAVCFQNLCLCQKFQHIFLFNKMIVEKKFHHWKFKGENKDQE